MAKKNNTPVEVTLIFDGNNWVESTVSTFDFDNYTFDGINWLPKA
jgi:hypothetical protein